MKDVSLLTALDGVTAVAADHPEIDTWWYAPHDGAGDAGARDAIPGPRRLDVVVAAAPGTIADCDQLATALTHRLGGLPVSVRNHRGQREEQPLFLLLRRRQEREVTP